MRYKKVRFFGCLLSLQEKWLNRMSQQGYHLINTSRAIYEFETCTPGEYQRADRLPPTRPPCLSS